MNALIGLPQEADVIVAGILGLILGSFTNVCIHRVPERRSVVWPGSRCPVCGTSIRWYDNLPVVSWLLLRGRCRSCAASISAQYPLVEAIAAVLLIALCLQHGLSLRWAALSWLSLSILALIPIDFRLGILPDRITLTGLGVGLLVSPFTEEPGWRWALAGALAGAAIPFVIRLLYIGWSRIRATDAMDDADERREGIGLGDVKMLAMVGSFLGPENVVLTIILGSVLGTLTVAPLLVRGRIGMKAPIPFGPFLGLAALIAVFWGPAIIDWYLDIAFSPVAI